MNACIELEKILTGKPEEEILFNQIKDHVSSLPKAEHDKVVGYVKVITDIINSDGELGLLAFSLMTCAVALKYTKP